MWSKGYGPAMTSFFLFLLVIAGVPPEWSEQPSASTGRFSTFLWSHYYASGAEGVFSAFHVYFKCYSLVSHSMPGKEHLFTASID